VRCCNTWGPIASFLASRCNIMYVLSRNFVVALVVVVVAIVSDLWQRGLPWLHLNLSIATLFVPTGEQRSDRDSSLIGTQSNSKSFISIGGQCRSSTTSRSPSRSPRRLDLQDINQHLRCHRYGCLDLYISPAYICILLDHDL